MKKTELMYTLKEALSEGKPVQIFIENPELPELEVIDIKALNIPAKIKYYESAYDENCQLVTAKQIKIVHASAYSFENLIHFRKNYVLTHWVGKPNSSDAMFIETVCQINENVLDSLEAQKAPQFIKVFVDDGEEYVIKTDNIYSIKQQY